MKLHFFGFIPIPVGHRVEVIWYRKPNKSLLGKMFRDSAFEEHLLIDLDTGIRYGGNWLYSNSSVRHVEVINLKEHVLLPELIQVRKVTGTVISCSIVPFSGDHTETELHIKPSE